jgi:predicted TIM-barrel fold metal-dependent hydrolase
MNHLFDVNCFLGRRAIHTPLPLPTTVPELLAEMDRLGIAEALVTHNMALDGHPWEGNQRLMREIAGQPRLHPCWMLLPTTGEMPPPTRLVAEMRAQGVRAARMCPIQHRYLFTEANVGDLLAALEAARIPLIVDFGMMAWSEEKTDWRSLDDLCMRHPNLPLIVVGEGMAAPRRVYPLWQRHRNLLLETSYYQVHQGLSDIAERFGADKLLFGSGLPTREAGAPLMQLRYDFLSDADREAIGGGNLRRLLRGAFGGEDSRQETLPSATSNVTDLPPHPIIDSHAHLGIWFSTYVNNGEADGLIRSMDRLGIQKMALMAFDAIGPDMRGGNDRTAAAMRAYPGRFLGQATVDPNESAGMTAELERCFNELGFHGIKFHCDLHGYPADSDQYRPAFEYADAHNLPILIHGVITERMLKTYPRAQFLSAHVGAWDGKSPNYAIQLSQDYPNIHLELCSSRILNHVMEKMVEVADVNRIVYGSDAPLMDPGYQMGRVLTACLSPADKEKIFYRNAVRLFHLEERGEC